MFYRQVNLTEVTHTKMQVLSVKTQIYCFINQLRFSANAGSHHHSDPKK